MNSSKLSINKAAQDWNISRNTLYKALKDGKLSKDVDGKIDVSEMIRVFGSPSKAVSAEQSGQSHGSSVNAQAGQQIEQELRKQIRQLEQQLADAKEREIWLKRQIEDMKPRLVEHKQKGLLSRFFG